MGPQAALGTGRIRSSTSHPAVRFRFESGSVLVFDDVRRFGTVERLTAAGATIVRGPEFINGDELAMLIAVNEFRATDDRGTSGSANVAPSATGSYTLTCTGAGGTNSASATITVLRSWSSHQPRRGPSASPTEKPIVLVVLGCC